MDKINIFWIEDNPLFGTAQGTTDRLDKFKELLPDNDSFSFTLFQHPYEVREFLDMKSCLKEEWQYFSEKCPANIPDIVVFDYKLSESFKPTNPNSLQHEETDMKNILSAMSASIKFKNAFPEIFKKTVFVNYTKEDRMNVNENIAKSIAVNAGGLANLDDEFGLFCGLCIIREFKDSITSGVPATINKPEVSSLSSNSAFFEWINKYDLEDALERVDKSSKNFKKDILPFSARLLRKRILLQVSSNKITLNLTQLLAWANQNPTEQEKQIIKERGFTFQSAYGIRHLPLDGLFIDVVNANKRDLSIKEWIMGKEDEPDKHGLLGIITSSLPVLKETIMEYEKIYKTYKKKFLNRILLSDFSKRKKENNLGSYADQYEELKSIFGVTKDKKISEDNLCSVKQVFADKKSGKNSNWTDDDKSKLRLLVLLLCTKLWIDHQKGAKKQADNIPLIKEDYFYILNPVVNSPLSDKKDAKDKNPLLLLMHNPLDNVSDYTDTFGDWLNKKDKRISRTEWHKFEWVSLGEKRIAMAFFQPELYGLTKRPDWLYKI